MYIIATSGFHHRYTSEPWFQKGTTPFETLERTYFELYSLLIPRGVYRLLARSSSAQAGFSNFYLLFTERDICDNKRYIDTGLFHFIAFLRLGFAGNYLFLYHL